MRKKAVIILLAVLCALTAAGASAAEGNEFSVSRVGQIVCFGNGNAFDVTAPEDGKVTITIRTDTSVFRVIEAEVHEGKNRIGWDGLGYNLERLYPMTYHIDAQMTGLSGAEYHTRFDSPVANTTQAMQFALGSADTAYLDDPEGWFLEIKTIQDGTAVIEFYRDGSDEPAYSFRRSVKTGRINRLDLKAVTGKNTIEPGDYTLRVYEMSAPGFEHTVSLRVEGRKPADIPVGVTGKTMPDRGDSDEEIWRLMTQTAVVVDIKNTDHQEVYREPDAGSGSLGTLHGQTQTLCVLEIDGAWARIEAWNHEEGEKIRGWVPAEKLKTVQPRTEYGLLIDKQEQTLTVFREGKRLETILVCTGRMKKDELYQETAAGSFLTGEHRVDYSTNGLKYDYVIQYDGGNLIHQIPYAHGVGKKDFTEGRGLLGAKASHACIRVQAEPGPENGINAYWIWTHIPYRTRVIILDDPAERQHMKAILADGEAGSAETSEFRIGTDETEQAAGEPDGDSVVITFGGDAVLGGRETYFRRKDSLFAYVTEYGTEYPFSGLAEYFATDDLTCVNLECVLKADGTGEDTKKQWRFRGYPEYTQILKDGSVEFVSTANNHTIDYGEEGYRATIAAIDGQVGWCGPESPAVVEIKGHKIGFGACRETAYKEDPGVIARDIRKLKEMGSEFIVYQCHWGTEYEPHRNAMQEAMARTCVRAGADLVVGHHPHVVQGIEEIGGVPVVYSLGNLCFGGTILMSGYDGMLARAVITFHGDQARVTVTPVPILTSSRAAENVNDYHPVPAEGEDAERILKLVQRDSGLRAP